MLKHLVIASACASVFALTAISVSNASETKDVTRQVTIYTIEDNAAFKAKVEAVCADTSLKLSDKARAACASHTFPNLVKRGERFRNAGMGAELNALASQK